MEAEEICIEDKLKILNEVIEELPDEFIRYVNINYDARVISIILTKLVKNKNNKIIIFTNLKYNDYKMEDIYYLISKIANLMITTNLTFFPNYKKDGFNIFINKNLSIILYKNNDYLTMEFL